MKITIIDLETTGTEPTDKVVEIAACDLREDGTIGIGLMPYLSAFVNPGIPIPPNLSAIHHITDEDVATALAWDQAIALFMFTELSCDAYAAHNAKFERQWVTDAITGGKPWICTYRCALRVWPDAPGHQNQQLRYWLKPEGLDRGVAAAAHRAGPDSYVTAFILRELLKHATIEQLIEWSSQPALLRRISFGKHRGMLWSEVPSDYLKWITNQPDMSEDIVFTAKHYTKQFFIKKANADKLV